MLERTSPLVSIVIPCYNYGRYLNFTLDSILTQSYSQWECILIDDGSTDNTKTVATAYAAKDKRFVYLFQNNSGPSGARNNGLSHATGKYIQFLDADDLIDKEKLKLQVNFLEQHEGADLVYGNALFFDTNELPEGKIANAVRGKYSSLKISGKGGALVKNLCINNFIEISCPLIRKTLIDNVGYFDTGYLIYEDWQYWFRAALAGAYFAYEPMPGTETYISHGHASLLGNIKKCLKYGIQLRSYMMPSLPIGLKLYNLYRMFKLQIKKGYIG
jgi:glycosyltransferase involved in cell wall biosynthesis